MGWISAVSSQTNASLLAIWMYVTSESIFVLWCERWNKSMGSSVLMGCHGFGARCKIKSWSPGWFNRNVDPSLVPHFRAFISILAISNPTFIGTYDFEITALINGLSHKYTNQFQIGLLLLRMAPYFRFKLLHGRHRVPRSQWGLVHRLAKLQTIQFLGNALRYRTPVGKAQIIPYLARI